MRERTSSWSHAEPVSSLVVPYEASIISSRVVGGVAFRAAVSSLISASRTGCGPNSIAPASRRSHAVGGADPVRVEDGRRVTRQVPAVVRVRREVHEA
ncbi:hypothetical protein ACFV7R_39770 [Streptomyces sp. NPDC059866]|uniref:hypothetical protein n=1 Tax=Streptomyces sp. NPDC059866 TaxID=3346978 RepID=UPI003664B9D5